MAIDTINFSITIGGEVRSKKETVLHRVNREKIHNIKGRSNIEVNEKQKKNMQKQNI